MLMAERILDNTRERQAGQRNMQTLSAIAETTYSGCPMPRPLESHSADPGATSSIVTVLRSDRLDGTIAEAGASNILSVLSA